MQCEGKKLNLQNGSIDSLIVTPVG